METMTKEERARYDHQTRVITQRRILAFFRILLACNDVNGLTITEIDRREPTENLYGWLQQTITSFREQKLVVSTTIRVGKNNFRKYHRLTEAGRAEGERLIAEASVPSRT